MKQSDVLKIFNDHSSILTLPIRIKSGEEFYKTLYVRWNRFIKMLQRIPELADCIPFAEKSVVLLKSIIKAYYKADYQTTSKRILELINMLTTVKNSRLITDLNSLYIDVESKQWFRGRITNAQPLTRNSMRHIPANERAKIGNNRYSINGIPCLYIGNSVQCCWEEFGRPSLDTFWVCRYRPQKTVKVLNLSTTGNDIVNARTYLKCVADSTVPYDDAVKEFFSNWILQSACSVVIEESGRKFLEEYVIPQLLMQNIKLFKVDGIMYFSTRVAFGYQDDSSWLSRNIAIPAFDTTGFNGKTGLYSKKIDSLFDISHPINVGFFANGVIPIGPKGYHESYNQARSCAPVLYCSQKSTYKNTLFYKCEIELQNYF